MEEFDALSTALEDWFERPLTDLPDTLRQRVSQEFFPMPWGQLSADQRRSVALQLDYQHDPATEQERKFWWDFFQRIDALNKQVSDWEEVATPTATELALKESKLAELRREIAQMNDQKRYARGDYFPHRKLTQGNQVAPLVESDPAARYTAYPKAMQQLTARLRASPAELAAWIWSGPENGGIAAYLNANELDPPPRFFYAYCTGRQDYVAPLMACWFNEADLAKFDPVDRYIVGVALIERWAKRPGLHAEAFIRAKVAESRLLDIHPIYGGTRGTFSEHSDWPALETGLFALAQVEAIEAEDFEVVVETNSLVKTDEVAPVVPREENAIGSPEWRKQNAKAAANALHDKPGGSRDKQSKIREIWASGKYSSRTICAEQECAGLNMSYDAARKALTNTPDPSRC